jgi:glycerol-3-phosphate acyltransferase PlsX
MKIAIDTMGGDFAPDEIIKGAIQSANEYTQTGFILVGQEGKIKEVISNYPTIPENIIIKHASDIVETHEHPVKALRNKPDSSILRCVDLVKEKEVDCFISAGSTGATVASSILKLGLLEGVKRAGILTLIPTENGFCGLIDAGANIGSKPIHLLQYAIMGSIYMRLVHQGSENRFVGLLNVGKEHIKGTLTIRLAYHLLRRFINNFGGNVEGHEIFSGRYALAVCDGFIGNILLKMGEGLSNFLTKEIQRADKNMGKFLSKFDYSEYGGALLLGVNGIAIICHGRSTAKAIKNAIKIAIDLAEKKINERISEEIKEKIKEE